MYLGLIVYGIRNFNIKPHITIYNNRGFHNENQCIEVCGNAFEQSRNINNFLRDYSTKTTAESGWKLSGNFGQFCAITPKGKLQNMPEIHISTLYSKENQGCKGFKPEDFINKNDVMHVTTATKQNSYNTFDKVISAGNFQQDGRDAVRESYQDMFEINECVQYCLGQNQQEL